MKKFILLFLLSMISMFSIPFSHTEAADIWINHWNTENIDIYMMEDTLSATGNRDSFTVSTKMVTNGRLKEIVTWYYGKSPYGMWRYETNTMRRDHTTVVCVHDKLFEYCMNYLGWPYEIRNHLYY